MSEVFPMLLTIGMAFCGGFVAGFLTRSFLTPRFLRWLNTGRGE